MTFIGEEDEAVPRCGGRAASVHGHDDTPELREQIVGMLAPETSYQPGTREQEPLPG